MLKEPHLSNVAADGIRVEGRLPLCDYCRRRGADRVKCYAEHTLGWRMLDRSLSQQLVPAKLWVFLLYSYKGQAHLVTPGKNRV